MIRTKLCLILLIFLAALAQISVFSTWVWWASSPQIWLVVVFFLLNFSLNKSAAFIFLLFYFLFYDLLVFSRPAFVESLFLIMGLSVFQILLSRILGRKLIFLAVSFLWLNLLGLIYWRLGPGLTPAIFAGQTIVNLLFYFVAWPGLYLVKLWLSRNEGPQLSFKI